MRWLTADHHFGHRNIIEFANRPWKSIGEHDEWMIEAWNEVVGGEDEVWVLGDFAFVSDRWELKRLVKRLKGKKHLVLGNHDGTRARHWETGEWESVEKIGMVDGVVLCHDALGWTIKNGWSEGWPRMFCGHVHGNWKVTWGRYVNVGVDQWGYRPVEWGEAAKLFKD